MLTADLPCLPGGVWKGHVPTQATLKDSKDGFLNSRKAYSRKMPSIPGQQKCHWNFHKAEALNLAAWI